MDLRVAEEALFDCIKDAVLAAHVMGLDKDRAKKKVVFLVDLLWTDMRAVHAFLTLHRDDATLH
jgi:hypothetical protein